MYTGATALENIRRLKSLIPDAQFTADILVGFPGENEEDFKKSAEFITSAELLDAHIFTFSAREGTSAYTMDGKVNEAEKHRRTRELIKVKNAQRDKVLEGIVEEQKPLLCIFES